MSCRVKETTVRNLKKNHKKARPATQPPKLNSVPTMPWIAADCAITFVEYLNVGSPAASVPVYLLTSGHCESMRPLKQYLTGETY